MNLLGAQANSPLCPPGDGTLAFGPTTDGLKFIYNNAAGFVGRGTCGLQAVPKAGTFQCTYKVKDATLGTGSGMGSVTFVPRLNQPPIILNTRPVGVSGRDNYSNRACPYAGIGASFFIVSGGGWDAKASQAQNCPLTHFSNPNFTTTAKTIFVTAPGMSGASCEPAPTLLNPEAKIEVTPTSVVFGSSPQTVTIKNPGTATLNLSVFTATGPSISTPTTNASRSPREVAAPSK